MYQDQTLSALGPHFLLWLGKVFPHISTGTVRQKQNSSCRTVAGEDPLSDVDVAPQDRPRRSRLFHVMTGGAPAGYFLSLIFEPKKLKYTSQIQFQSSSGPTASQLPRCATA